MQTSYFAKSANNPLAISIARSAPKWYHGKHYPALAPSWSLVKVEDPIKYEYRYRREVLDRLNPKKVLAEIEENAILLCWEKPGEFCHRRIVAAWLSEELGIEIPELYYIPEEEPDPEYEEEELDEQLCLFKP